MAIARKCDRCGELYEPYDHIECNDVPIDKVITSYLGDDLKVQAKTYDLCPNCCFEFARWIVDPMTMVIKNDLTDGIEKFNKVDTTLYVDGKPIFTQKENGDVEWHNQLQAELSEEKMQELDKLIEEKKNYET